MAASKYFVANDYDLAFNLQKLFHEYVALYTKLNYPDNGNEISNKERRELDLKLLDAVNEMSLLVMKMKRFKSDTEILKSTHHQTISATKRSLRLSYS